MYCIRLSLSVLLAAMTLVAVAGGALGTERHALVVGIDGYANVPALQKARNDAEAMHGALQAAGFRSELVLDADLLTLLERLEVFGEGIDPGDEAVFFFAGHGVEIDGRNYLLPADTPLPDRGGDLLVRRSSLPLEDVTTLLRQRGARVSLVILDACRDNPFERAGTRAIGGSRGLARTDPPEGTFILYSAGAGQTALDRLSDDDPDPNSVFTRVLLPRIAEPGAPLRNVVQEVRSEVRRLARSVGHNQFPAVYDQLDGSFLFLPAAVGPGDGGPVAEPPAMASPTDLSGLPVPAPSADPCAAAMSVWVALQGTEHAETLAIFERSYAESCPALAALARERMAALAPPPTRAASPAEPCLAAAGRNGGARSIARPAEALAACRAAADALPEAPEVLDALARAHAAAEEPVEAARWYRRAAEAGSAAAMHDLARLFQRGQGVAADPVAALGWYRRAAEADHVPAMFEMGRIHEFGLGVAQDHGEALGWYRRAAEAGHPEAMGRVGTFLLTGQGVRQDFAAALDWLRRGAEAGSRASMENIGWMHYYGAGMSADDREAARWFLMSLQGRADRLSWAEAQAPSWRQGTLREMQRILQQAGVYGGALNGQFGPQTLAALSRYAGAD